MFANYVIQSHLQQRDKIPLGLAGYPDLKLFNSQAPVLFSN